MVLRIFSDVPTGTVLFVTTTIYFVMICPISFATFSTCFRSADPSSPGGVPTAIKITSDPSIPSFISVVKESLFFQYCF